MAFPHLLQNTSPFYEKLVKVYTTLIPILKDNNVKVAIDPPNRYHNVTTSYFILRTLGNPGFEKIDEIFTPMGSVTLLWSGNVETHTKLSKEFLTVMDWDLVNINDTVHFSHFHKGNPTTRCKVNCDHKTYATSYNYYFVKRIGTEHYPIPEDPFFYSTYTSGVDELPERKEIFYRLIKEFVCSD